MAVLTSSDLRIRFHLALRGYQFPLADNRSDLNYIRTDLLLACHGHPPIQKDDRCLNYELEAVV